MKYFQNHQWQVNDDGLDGDMHGQPYEIDTKRLLETRSTPRGTFYEWPLHLAEKTWIDYEAFAQAFTEALKHHVPHTYDAALLSSSLQEGRREMSRR